ncbi:phage minor head protein [Grimontia sp. SpTr1]|uniref:phage head morphogenesis protein n=1 Tax=Grimontia sp. SpTr1 TaxID=2995319 RepID=UPI00248AB699|nr:phage minor head protein [Grimontia sp. SpTr1]
MDIHEAVTVALAQGKTLERFKAELEPKLAKRGWLGRALMPDGSVVELGTPRRLKLIYDTNLRTSRAAGQWARIDSHKAVLPYLRYGLGPSKEHREDHVQWEGLVLPVDDLFWDTHMPPNGFGCRCRVRQLTADEAKKRGISESPDLRHTTWTHKRTGEVMEVPEGVDPGWDHNPGKARASERQRRDKEKTQAFEQTVGTADKPAPLPRRVVPSALSTLKNIDGEDINRILEAIPGAAERIDKLRTFTHTKGMKTLIIKQAEMGERNRGASLIRDRVIGYLDEEQERYGRYNYTIRNPARVGGFTADVFNHVVVKGNSKVRFSERNVEKVASSLKASVKEAAGQRGPDDSPRRWTLGTGLSPEAELVATWVHEVGHQVHFWAGGERAEMVAKRFLSRYAMSGISMGDFYEYHAEHFCAWLFDRDAFAEFDPEAADYFDRLIDKAIDGKERKRHDRR